MSLWQSLISLVCCLANERDQCDIGGRVKVTRSIFVFVYVRCPVQKVYFSPTSHPMLLLHSSSLCVCVSVHVLLFTWTAMRRGGSSKPQSGGSGWTCFLRRALQTLKSEGHRLARPTSTVPQPLCVVSLRPDPRHISRKCFSTSQSVAPSHLSSFVFFL